MPLCAICNQLDIKDFTDWEDDIQDVPHHASLWELKLSSSSCTVCKLIYTEFMKHKFFREPKQEERNTPVVLRGGQHVDEDWNAGGIYIIRARCDSIGIKAWLGLFQDEGTLMSQ
jgi:hypothetical protein